MCMCMHACVLNMHRLSVFEDLHYDKRRRAFFLNKQSLRGLHATMSDAFFPSYSFERATIGPLSSSSSSESKSKSPSAKRKARTRFTRNRRGGGGSAHEAAMRTGNKVDQQLARVTELLRAYPGLSVKDFVAPPRTLATRLTNNETARNRVMNCRRALIPHTKRILKALHDMRLVPIDSQVVVCNELLRLGTAVDLVCRHEGNKKITIIEIKCGYETYIHHHTIHNMSEPFTAMNDSPANQHQLQLEVNDPAPPPGMYN